MKFVKAGLSHYTHREAKRERENANKKTTQTQIYRVKCEYKTRCKALEVRFKREKERIDRLKKQQQNWHLIQFDAYKQQLRKMEQKNGKTNILNEWPTNDDFFRSPVHISVMCNFFAAVFLTISFCFHFTNNNNFLSLIFSVR